MCIGGLCAVAELGLILLARGAASVPVPVAAAEAVTAVAAAAAAAIATATSLLDPLSGQLINTYQYEIEQAGYVSVLTRDYVLIRHIQA